MSTERDAEDLARSVGSLAPRPGVRARLVADVARTPQEEAAGSHRRWALAATAAAVVLGATLWLATTKRSEEPAGLTVTGPGRAAARAPWEEPPEVAKERLENEAVYEREKERLHREHKGKMFLIVHGKLVELTSDLPRPKPGDRAKNTAAHAFMFRVGQDGPREEVVSEWYAPRFAGLALPKALDLEWSTDQRTLRVKAGNRELRSVGNVYPRYLFDLQGPGRESGVTGPRLTAREVYVSGVGPPLMLAPEDVVALDLARWEIPGLVTIWNHVKCRQARVLVSVAGWESQEVITALWPLTPRENLIGWARIRDSFWSGPYLSMLPVEEADPFHDTEWILFGRDRVLAGGPEPTLLLGAVEQDSEATYHRYLMRWPRGPELVLEEARLSEADPVSLNSGPVRARSAGPEGPFLVDAATASGLRLERAEDARSLVLKKTDGSTTELRGGYAWLGEPLRSPTAGKELSTHKAVLVVYPFTTPRPPPPGLIPDPMRPR